MIASIKRDLEYAVMNAEFSRYLSREVDMAVFNVLGSRNH
jgi:hypothetical protein